MGTSERSTEYAVVVVGGGPAGCSTAVSIARYGLGTPVLECGNSSIRRCALDENLEAAEVTG